MGLSQFDETIGTVKQYPLAPADGIVVQDLWDTAPYQSRIDVIVAGNSDVIPHVVRFYYSTGGTTTLLGSVSVPAGAGTLGTPTVDMLAAFPVGLQAGMLMPPGTILQVQNEVVAGAATAVDVTAFGALL
jgi:hypothetical protein